MRATVGFIVTSTAATEHGRACGMARQPVDTLGSSTQWLEYAWPVAANAVGLMSVFLVLCKLTTSVVSYHLLPVSVNNCFTGEPVERIR